MDRPFVSIRHIVSSPQSSVFVRIMSVGHSVTCFYVPIWNSNPCLSFRYFQNLNANLTDTADNIAKLRPIADAIRTDTDDYELSVSIRI